MRMKRFLAALVALCLLALCAPITGAMADANNYYITVDVTNQIVTVYDSEKTDDINIVRQMICSTGRNATPTPLGTYRLPSRSSTERTEWYYFSKFKCYAKYATRITGGILFHSTLFTAAKKGPTGSSTRALGSKASHGCVRLRVADAKFIADNCPTGTKVRIFKSGKVNSKLRSKLKRKTFIRDKQTYDSFLGRKPTESPLPLSRGSTGSLVTQLQTRLKELGFYNGAINGAMGKSTVTAVKAFEAAAGLGKAASVNQALWDTIFAGNAATGTLVTLSEGSTGPAVSVLQDCLTTLLPYSGDVDGTYSAQTAQAVANYQNTFGFDATGSADTDVQDDIIARAAQVKQDFAGSTYALTTVTTDAQMAKVKAKYGTKLLKSASKKAKSIRKLKKNASMRVLSQGKTWTKVKVGTRTGYVKRSALKFYSEPVTENGYTKVEVSVESAPTPTPEVSLPAEAGDALVTEAAEVETVALEAADGALIFGTEDADVPEDEDEDVDDAEEELFEALEPEATPEPEVVPENMPEDAPVPEESVESPAPEVEANTEITEE